MPEYATYMFPMFDGNFFIMDCCELVVFLAIGKYLSEWDILCVTTANRHLYSLRWQYRFQTPVRLHRICALGYFHVFARVIVSDLRFGESLPEAMTHLTIRTKRKAKYRAYWCFPSLATVTKLRCLRLQGINSHVNYLPTNLEKLDLSDGCSGIRIGCWPENLTHLACCVTALPQDISTTLPNLRKLRVQVLKDTTTLAVSHTLTGLTIIYESEIPNGDLKIDYPPGLAKLKIKYSYIFNTLIPLGQLTALKYLSISAMRNLNNFSATLQVLRIKSTLHNSDIDLALVPELRELHVGSINNVRFRNLQASRVRKLSLDSYVDELWLPPALQSLSIKNINIPASVSWPATLQKLKCHKIDFTHAPTLPVQLESLTLCDVFGIRIDAALPLGLHKLSINSPRFGLLQANMPYLANLRRLRILDLQCLEYVFQHLPPQLHVLEIPTYHEPLPPCVYQKRERPLHIRYI